MVSGSQFSKLLRVGAVASIALTGSCSSPTDEVAIEQRERGAQDAVATSLTETMSGRLPQISAYESWVIAYSGTDFDLDHETTIFSVSANGGHSFDIAPFDEQLYNPGIVIRESDAIIVGVVCSRPPMNEGFSCAPDNEHLVARRLDLDTLTVHELPDPPFSGVVSDSVGWAADRAWFDMSSDAGRSLLGWSDEDGWLVTDLPDATQRVCPIGDTLVTITAGAGSISDPPPSDPGSMEESSSPTETSGAAIEPVDRGLALFSALTSSDGMTWSDPVAFESELDNDFNFTVGVSCGPTAVVAYTKQIGVYTPDESAWRPIPVPLNVAVGPGAANAWRSDDELRLWSLPATEGIAVDDTPAAPPRTTHTQLRLWGLSRGPVQSDVVEPEQDLGSTPQELRGAGAASHGFILLVDDDFTLVKV